MCVVGFVLPQVGLAVFLLPLISKYLEKVISTLRNSLCQCHIDLFLDSVHLLFSTIVVYF